MSTRFLDVEKFGRFFLQRRYNDFFFSSKKLGCFRIRCEKFLIRSLKDDISAMNTCSWSDIDDLMSRTHDILVMFDNDDSISKLHQFLEIFDQKSTISRMKSDRWLIEDIGNSLETCPYLGSKSYALRLSS